MAMQDLPHQYAVSATTTTQANVTLRSQGLPDLSTAGPPEFGGPGDVWSPETLLVGAVADCLVLSFRAIARAAKLEWESLNCEAVGTLDKVERVTRFTGFDLKAELTVPAGTDDKKAHRLLEKAEQHCLITNSLKAPGTLVIKVRVAG